jgi:dolichol kinase
MSEALTLETRSLALDLHRLLKDIDSARFRESLEASFRERVTALERRASELTARFGAEERAAMVERLSDVVRLLRDKVPQPGLSSAELQASWAAFRAQAYVVYEGLAHSLRERAVRLPNVRPTNYARSLWHVSVAAVVVVLVEAVLDARMRWLVPLTFASTFWVLEGLRHVSATARRFLLWIFRHIAHPHERHRINSATYFATGLTVLGLLFDPLICGVAVAILGTGDPAAAWIGRRYGRTRLVANRTLEGTIAFFVAATLAALAVMAVFHGDLAWSARILIAVAAALPAAVTELVSTRVDDNLSIPLAAAGGAWLATGLL